MQDGILNVLQVHNRQKVAGGADVVIEREAQLLRSFGHKTSLFSVESRDIENTASWRIARNVVWNSDAARLLRECIRKEKPDILHVHTIFPVLSPIVFRVAKELAVPVVETMHNFRLVCPGGLLKRDGATCEKCVGKKVPWPAIVHGCYRGSRLQSFGMASSLALHHYLGTFENCVDRYVALTHFVREKMIQGGYPASKIVVKSNFVINDSPPGTGAGKYILYVGRFHPEKGVMTIIRAWQRLASPPRLILVGDGPQLAEVEQESKGLNIEIQSWKQTDEILELMRNASLVLFPSEIYETGPLVPLESWSCGTPVIASDVGNFSSWIAPGLNGFLFRSGDAGDLARVVAEVARDSRLRNMRQYCYDSYLEKFSAESNYRDLMAIYLSLLQ